MSATLRLHYKIINLFQELQNFSRLNSQPCLGAGELEALRALGVRLRFLVVGTLEVVGAQVN